jgi:hypothetical protein
VGILGEISERIKGWIRGEGKRGLAEPPFLLGMARMGNVVRRGGRRFFVVYKEIVSISIYPHFLPPLLSS